MASSGSFNTSTVTIATGTTARLTFSWTRTSYNLANNTSTIDWELTCTKSGSNASAYAYNVRLSISGAPTAYRYTATNLQNGDVIGQGTLTLTHSAEGSRQLGVSCSAYLSGTAGTYSDTNTSGTGNWYLDPLPVAVSSISASDVTSGNTCSVTWTPASAYGFSASAFSYSLQFKLGSVQETKSNISITGSPSSYTYTGFTMSSSKWGPAIPNSTSGVVTVILYTYCESVLLGSCSDTFTFTLANTVVPTVSATLTNIGNVTTFGYLQKYSKVGVSSTGQGVDGSSVVSYSVDVNNQTLSGNYVTTLQLKTAGRNYAVVTVTDSRGRTGTVSVPFDVVPYSSPTISDFTVSRCTQTGGVDDVGDCFHVLGSTTHTDLSQIVAGTVRGTTIKYRRTGTTEWTTLVNRDTSTSYTLTNSSIVVQTNPDYSYEVSMTVEDGVITINQIRTVSNVFVLMDFLADGYGMAIGKVATTTNLLEVNLPTLFDKEVTFNGGLYPVDSIVCMSTSTADPSLFLGGTWTLVDKEFTPTYSTTSVFTRNTSSVSSVSTVLRRENHTVHVRVSVTTSVALSESDVTLGTLSLSGMGVDDMPAEYVLGFSDGANGIGIGKVESDGTLYNHDVIAKSGSSIASGSTLHYEIKFIVRPAHMLNSACDKFYFKRTA